MSLSLFLINLIVRCDVRLSEGTLGTHVLINVCPVLLGLDSVSIAYCTIWPGDEHHPCLDDSPLFCHFKVGICHCYAQPPEGNTLRLVDFEPPILPAYVPHGAAAPPRFFWKWSEWSSRHGCSCASSQQNSCGRARACRAASVYWLGFSGARKDVCVNLTTLWESDIEMAIPFVRLKTRKGLESCFIPHYNFPGSYVWFTRKQSQTCMHSKHDKCWSINYFF